MLGICYCILCAASLLCGIVLGRLPETTGAAIDGAARAVELIIALAGMSALWSGVMAVLREAGMIRRLGKVLSPLLRHIFPDAWRDADAREEITAAVSANMLGIGNAATPLALRAMGRLAELNPHPEKASADMITFTVLAVSAPSLLPSTLIALRRAAGSARPYAITVPVWIVSFTCAAAGILLCRLAAWAAAGRTRHD